MITPEQQKQLKEIESRIAQLQAFKVQANIDINRILSTTNLLARQIPTLFMGLIAYVTSPDYFSDTEQLKSSSLANIFISVIGTGLLLLQVYYILQCLCKDNDRVLLKIEEAKCNKQENLDIDYFRDDASETFLMHMFLCWALEKETDPQVKAISDRYENGRVRDISTVREMLEELEEYYQGLEKGIKEENSDIINSINQDSLYNHWKIAEPQKIAKLLSNSPLFQSAEGSSENISIPVKEKQKAFKLT